MALVYTNLLATPSGDGRNVAEELRQTLEYWDANSGRAIELLMAGWSGDMRSMTFDARNFDSFAKEIQARSTWIYSGETDVVIADFRLMVDEALTARFDFTCAIVIRLEQLIRQQGHSMSYYLERIVDAAEAVRKAEPQLEWSPTFALSDHLVIGETRRGLWEGLKAFLRETLHVRLDGVEAFTTLNIARDGNYDVRLTEERQASLRVRRQEHLR